MRSLRYRNRKRKRIDGYTVACATKQETGLVKPHRSLIIKEGFMC